MRKENKSSQRLVRYCSKGKKTYETLHMKKEACGVKSDLNRNDLGTTNVYVNISVGRNISSENNNTKLTCIIDK